MEALDQKKPLKAKNLKVIDHLGTYYATFDGSKVWKVEKWMFKLLTMCNGKKTFEEIAEDVAKMSGYSVEDIKAGLKPVFEEMERNGFIVYV